MTVKRLRVGDVVRIPPGIYGEFAVVERANQKQVDVCAPTGTRVWELAYEPEQLERVGHIEIGKAYSPNSKNRLRLMRCNVEGKSGVVRRYDVPVRGADASEGEETRTWMIRRLALAQALKDVKTP